MFSNGQEQKASSDGALIARLYQGNRTVESGAGSLVGEVGEVFGRQQARESAARTASSNSYWPTWVLQQPLSVLREHRRIKAAFHQLHAQRTSGTEGRSPTPRRRLAPRREQRNKQRRLRSRTVCGIGSLARGTNIATGAIRVGRSRWPQAELFGAALEQISNS